MYLVTDWEVKLKISGSQTYTNINENQIQYAFVDAYTLYDKMPSVNGDMISLYQRLV